MDKNAVLSSSATKINNSLSKRYELDDMDPSLCPPSLSPYALSILDDKVERNISSKHNTATLMNTTTMFHDITATSKANSNTQTTNITKTNQTYQTNQTTQPNTANSTLNNSRHSKFMTKLGLGAPRRLTTEGEFQTSRKSMDGTSTNNLEVLNNTLNPKSYINYPDLPEKISSKIKSIEENSNSNINMSNNIFDKMKTKIPTPSSSAGNLASSRGNFQLNRRLKSHNNNTPMIFDNKENISNCFNSNNLETLSTEKKRVQNFTPKKYSPVSKRKIEGSTLVDTINLHQTPVKKNSSTKNSPLTKPEDISVDSPEIGRRATIQPVERKNNIDANIFASTNKYSLDLELPAILKSESYSDTSAGKRPLTNTNDIDHLNTLLDKKKEIFSLKKEIAKYKTKLMEKQKVIDEQKLLYSKLEGQKGHALHSDDNQTQEGDNILEIHKHSYKLYEQIGRGGSSKVYRGSLLSKPHHYLAIKIVLLEDQDVSTVAELKGEIKILHKLRHCSRVVRLLDYALTNEKIFFVMECGDLDLAKVLSTRQSMKQFYDIEFIRYHAKEMVKCINEIHKLDVVHLDLKPANFVFVSGVLKLIDFGISNSIKGHTVNVYREYQMGTPNYMAPETLLDCAESDNGTSIWKVGKPADIWSLGCILYQLTYGTTPYASYTGTSKILAITNPAINISYPTNAVNLRKKQSNEGKQIEDINTDNSNVKVCPYLIDMIRKCLIRDPTKRITSTELNDNIFIEPVVVDYAVINEVVRGCVGFGGKHPELQDIALGKVEVESKMEKRGQERLDRLINGVWKRVGNNRPTQ